MDRTTTSRSVDTQKIPCKCFCCISVFGILLLPMSSLCFSPLLCVHTYIVFMSRVQRQWRIQRGVHANFMGLARTPFEMELFHFHGKFQKNQIKLANNKVNLTPEVMIRKWLTQYHKIGSTSSPLCKSEPPGSTHERTQNKCNSVNCSNTKLFLICWLRVVELSVWCITTVQ